MPIDAGDPIRLPAEAWDPAGPLVRACRDHDANALFRIVHQRYGITQERIADRVRMESGEMSRRVNNILGPIQHIDRWIRIAHGLGMPEHARRTLFQLPPISDPATPPDPAPADATKEPTTDRRALLRYTGLGITAATLASLVGAGRDGGSPVTGDGLESPLEIAGRVQSISATNVDGTALDLLDGIVIDVIDQYERVGPAVLAPHVVGQRRQLHNLMTAQQHPRQRDRLFLIGARLSGLLGVIALDLGNIGSARAYTIEAFHLAQMIEHAADAQAWVRGTQSLIEYYAGRYQDALDLARDGQRLSPGGPQTIRLIINGEARALGRLGDKHGVDAAVDGAQAWLADHKTTPAMSPSLALGPYCGARIDCNAATAYLQLGQPARAIEHGTRALSALTPLGLGGPQALTQLDLATALIQSPETADPEHATALVTGALSLPGADQFRPVAQRATEFITAVQDWRDLPAVHELTDAIHAFTAPSRPALT